MANIPCKDFCFLWEHRLPEPWPPKYVFSFPFKEMPPHCQTSNTTSQVEGGVSDRAAGELRFKSLSVLCH